MTKVSVIIPIYGVEKYIERCARSLFEQTLKEIEYIFVNDCTKDHSIEILIDTIKEYPHRKNQIRIENMPMNSGLPAVRRHGIQLAKGEFYITCDSDDWVEPTMYEEMYEYAIKHNLDLVQCDIDIVDDSKTISTLSYQTNETHSDKLKQLIINGDISNSLCNKLVAKNIYLNNKLEFPNKNMDEDNVLSIQLAFYAKKIGYIQKSFYKAYVNQNSTSRISGKDNVLKKFNDSLENSKIIIKFLDENGYSDERAFFIAKCRPKFIVLPYIKDHYFCHLWKSTYSEINCSLLKLPNYPIKTKIVFILSFLSLYPYFLCIYRLFKKS